MVKEILSADNNLHSKINAWRDFWFILPGACGVPSEVIIQVQSGVNHWMVAKHQLTDCSVYDYRIFFIKDPIANKLFIFLISTIANVMPESMWWLTGDLALPSDTSRLRHNSYRAGMNFKTTCIAGTFFCKRRLLHNYTSFRLEPPSCIICVISLLQIDWQFFPFCYKIPQRFAETSENWEASWYHILTGRTNKSETARQITGLTHTKGRIIYWLYLSKFDLMRLSNFQKVPQMFLLQRSSAVCRNFRKLGGLMIPHFGG